MMIRDWAWKALCEKNPEQKALLALDGYSLLASFSGAIDTTRTCTTLPENQPGRPERPVLVPPGTVPRRSVNTLQGRAALVHAICHIEFNAMNLALDAVWRFDGMPHAFYRDWMQVACEEAQHFTLLSQHLARMGHTYGDFDAHDGLWEMCDKTAHDVLARMALVPRTLEARGLDATPLIQARLKKAASPDALAVVAILDTVLRDEIGHVAIGNHWYRVLCEQRQLEPVAHYAVLARAHQAPRLRAPFNLDARLLAGFQPEEMAALHAQA
jgi:uncharacterized ferritin-like protein (DUF455 family)